ncbi:MAG: GNAT family N-acetyltransferase [Chloroflexi bacterium]|nr:GNAT family N-acetyltransferase [Chloroflexota bacterium]
MALEIRPVTREGLETFVKAHRRVFGDPIPEDSIRLEASLIDLEQTRALAVFDGAKIVGTTVSHAFEMTVPGGLLPLAGVADVTVQPTHRRKGILTQMMSRQLQDSYEKGESLAALWPSETVIYGRFGYGMASFCERWSIERHHTSFGCSPESHGRVVFVEPDEASKVFPDVFQRVCLERPGMVRRNATWWGYRLLDIEQFRQGASEYYHAIYERDGRADGYVLYRISSSDNTLRIVELVAATDEAYAALWQFCFGVDLINTTRAENQPIDSPLLVSTYKPYGIMRSVVFLASASITLPVSTHFRRGRV